MWLRLLDVEPLEFVRIRWVIPSTLEAHTADNACRNRNCPGLLPCRPTCILGTI